MNQAYLIRNPAKQVKHLEGMQILVHGLVDIHREFLLELDGGLERFPEGFELRRSLFGAEFIVDDLEGTGLLDGAVRRRTVGAMHDFAGHRVDCFGDDLPLHVLEIRPPETLDEYASVWLF